MKVLKLVTLGIFFGCAFLFFTHSLGSINQDIGRHLKTGEIIWQTHSVPKINLFSYTEPNTPFINHHWLSEVAFYLLNIYIGLKGLIIFKSFVLLTSFFLIYLAIGKRVQPLVFAIALVPSLIVMAGRTDVRPEIFSYLFLAYFLFAIFRAKYDEDWKWFYSLPIVQILWTNSHIYFALGPLLLLLFIIGKLINNRNSKSKAPNSKQYQNSKIRNWNFFGIWSLEFGILVLTFLTTLLNPNFIHGALAPLTILSHYGYSIVENQSIFFLKDYGIFGTQINYFLLISIAFIVSFVPALKQHGFKKYFFELVTGLVFITLGTMMLRNFGPLAIVLSAIFAMNLQAYFDKLNLSQKTFRGLYITACVVGILLIGSVITSRAYGWIGSNDRFGLEIPVNAQGGVDFVKTHHLVSPVFNNFDVGSYLIWKLYPEQKVFVDGRPEAYTPDFFENIYKPMQEDPRVWKHYADDVYHINYIFFDYHDITPWARTFLSFISQDPNWPLVYKDSSVTIFVRQKTRK